MLGGVPENIVPPLASILKRTNPPSCKVGIPDSIEFIDIVGPFGTLLITGHDFGNSRKLWESSFKKMAEDVQPILSKYLKQKFAA